MAHDWLTNAEVVALVKRMLMETRVPLEAQIARICLISHRWFHWLTFDGDTFGLAA